MSKQGKQSLAVIDHFTLADHFAYFDIYFHMHLAFGSLFQLYPVHMKQHGTTLMPSFHGKLLNVL